MRWHNVARHRTSVKLRALALVIAVSGLQASPVLAVGVGTQITAQVCHAPLGSTINIKLPKSDSTVKSSTVTVKGDVTDATQINVSIDGVYSQTVPLGASDTKFNFDVSITKGTHTITLVANDVCNIQNSTDSVVITYNGSAGIGSETSTSAGGVQVGTGEPIETKDQDVYQKIKSNWLGGALIGLGEDAFNYSGLDTTFANGGWIVGALRVLTFSAGMMTIAFTTLALETYAAGFMQWFGKFLPENPVLNHQYQLWALRGFGLVFMVLAILL